MTKTNQTITCGRCNGTGYVSPQLSRGCAGDVCFRCNGRGWEVIRPERKVKAKASVEFVKCWKAGWIVNGQVRDGACEYYATQEAAMKAAARHSHWSVIESEIPASNAREIRTAAA